MTHHQDFYDYWRMPSRASDFDSFKEFPRELSLGAKLPFHTNRSKNWILVTESYETTFHRILDIRMDRGLPGRGLVLTGHPGIGVSPQPDPHPVWQLIGAPVLQEKLYF